jgi:ATP-dependent Lon protease
MQSDAGLDALDVKLNQVLNGKVVRKDLVHRIKKGTNVPTFVLEFLLARYCASDDPAEIQAGMEAVLATLQENYVRPDESNAAQSRVAMKGKHKFIDKIHVRYVEKEKRHWASLENFASQRVAIGEKYYRDNDRLLEGGIWAEAVIAHSDMDADNYAFYVEDLRPIQLTRFDFGTYVEARAAFSRDEWIDVVLRSVGLEPSKLNKRLKFHFIARLAPLVEANFNFIELGPRGTGKSYFFSEFSPYSTLISGGQATKSILFYNNARQKIGLVGFWDTVAFDEVSGIKVKDPDTIQIMKDYMANGRFSRGVEVIADASMAFVGNIDQSVEQIVNSTEYDLFLPLPPQFDLALMDRFACYLPRLGDAQEQRRVPDRSLWADHRLFGRGVPLPAQALEPLRGGQQTPAAGQRRRRPRREGHQEDPLRLPQDPPSRGPADRRGARGVCGLRGGMPPAHQGADEQAKAGRRVRPDRPVLHRCQRQGDHRLLSRVAERHCDPGAGAASA